MDFITRLRMFVNNDEAQDLLEYALLVALIALVCVGAIGLAGTNVNVIFGRIAAETFSRRLMCTREQAHAGILSRSPELIASQCWQLLCFGGPNPLQSDDATEGDGPLEHTSSN